MAEGQRSGFQQRPRRRARVGRTARSGGRLTARSFHLKTRLGETSSLPADLKSASGS